MIQIWSLPSTDTPMTLPRSQWFGSGLGHIGSTSNLGAVTPAALTLSSTAEPMPSAPMTATKAAPMRRSRLIPFSPPRSEVRYSSRVAGTVQAIIQDSQSSRQAKGGRAWLVLLLAVLHPAAAHDIPNDVTVRAFLKAQGQHLNLLARVPLKAIR